MDDLTLSIYLVLTPNVLLLDYAGPAETLRMARDMGAPIALHTCGPQAHISTSLSTSLSGLEPLPAQLPPRSLVLVVGNSNEVVDYATGAARAVVQWLRTAPQADTRLASICSGALLLAQAGCLDGRHCTTHHTLITDLQACAPTAQVVTDRILWTTAVCSPAPVSPPVLIWRCISWSRPQAPSWQPVWRAGW